MTSEIDVGAVLVSVAYALRIGVMVWGALWCVVVFKRVLKRKTNRDTWHPTQCLRLALNDDVAGFALAFALVLMSHAIERILWMPQWILRSFGWIAAPGTGVWPMVAVVLGSIGVCAGTLVLIAKMSGGLAIAVKEPTHLLWALVMSFGGIFVAYQIYTFIPVG